MASVIPRSSGRAWRLRHRSHALWGEWLAALELPAVPHWNWPGGLVWRGVNQVPRPDLAVEDGVGEPVLDEQGPPRSPWRCA